jgi:(p)ppGpp synthase/HD superfamily hydrolase
MLTNKLDAAYLFASRLHANQTRKCSNTPYVAHLMAVAASVLDYGGDEDTAVAALLHDAIEDQGASYPGEGATGLRRVIDRQFGGRVLRIVEELTETDEDPKPPWKERKDKYLAHLKVCSAEAILVAAADKVHNARSTLADIRTSGAVETWAKFNGDMESQEWWYTSLLNIFIDRKEVPEALVWELDEIVCQLFTFDYLIEYNRSPRVKYTPRRK